MGKVTCGASSLDCLCIFTNKRPYIGLPLQLSCVKERPSTGLNALKVTSKAPPEPTRSHPNIPQISYNVAVSGTLLCHWQLLRAG